MTAILLVTGSLVLQSLLPPGAQLVEHRDVPKAVRSDRALVLWMLNPVKSECSSPEEWADSCPDSTRGCHYSGPTRVSLVDTKLVRIINTIAIEDVLTGEDTFDVPYRVMTPGPYGAKRGRVPVLMRLRDYNGDGNPLEFAFFDALACMGLESTLIGYSIRRDQVIRFPIFLARSGASRTSEGAAQYWADYLFGQKPVRRGYWKYSIDYRGRGGTLDQYEVHYDSGQERFVGTCQSTP